MDPIRPSIEHIDTMVARDWVGNISAVSMYMIENATDMASLLIRNIDNFIISGSIKNCNYKN